MNSIILSENITKKNNHQNRTINLVKFTVFILLFIWCAGISFPVISPSFTGKSVIQYFLKFNYSVICHQSESADIYIGSNSFLVCARCLGIYSGAFLIAFLILLNVLNLKMSLRTLLICVMPLVVDAVAIRLNIYNYSRIVAFITGLLFGATILIFIYDSLRTHFNSLLD